MKNIGLILTYFFAHCFNLIGQAITIESVQNTNYKNADLVLLAKVVEIDSISLLSTLKVLETFKGKPEPIIKIAIVDGHSFLPNKDGLWLIYAKKLIGNSYSISETGISRNNINPERIFYYTPNPPRTKREKKEFPTKLLDIKIRAISDWNNELYRLRNHLTD
jgi:hypothetical protein